VLEILIAAAFGAFQAPECLVSFERNEEARIVLRMRPACTLGYRSTQGAPMPQDSKLPYDAILSITLGRP